MANLRDKQFDLRTGDIHGYVVKYSTTTAVAITAGEVEANGKFYTLPADTTHTMTSLAAAYDMHYLYIDDSASTEPTAVIIDSTTNPVFSNSKRGWYNGDDRLIGSLNSAAASAIVDYFGTKPISDKYIESVIGRGFAIATSMNPTGVWQDPNGEAGAAIIPVNSVSMNVSLNGADASATCAVYITSAEMAAVKTNIFEGAFESFQFNNTTITTGFFPLGVSRNVKVAGHNDDDNFLSVWLAGYGYTR